MLEKLKCHTCITCKHFNSKHTKNVLFKRSNITCGGGAGSGGGTAPGSSCFNWLIWSSSISRLDLRQLRRVGLPNKAQGEESRSESEERHYSSVKACMQTINHLTINNQQIGKETRSFLFSVFCSMDIQRTKYGQDVLAIFAILRTHKVKGAVPDCFVLGREATFSILQLLPRRLF